MSHGNSVSRTGLSVSPKKIRHFPIHKSKRLELAIGECASTKPVQYSIRPFAALFNPYSRNCSILCNHPGPNEIKQVVKQVKCQYADGKENIINEGYFHDYCNDLNYELLHNNQIIDLAKEEYFHHYAGSDSRPLTPTPTVISNRTRISNGSYLFQSRRCHTPDPVHMCATERKQLVLDLRRSHSQETVFCNASSELSFPVNGDVSAISSRPPPPPPPQPQLKNIRLCEKEARERSAERKAIQQLKECEPTPSTIVCINNRNDADDETDGVRRRGKKKKKIKDGNTFRMNQEPETQIATIGLDSPNASARPAGNIVNANSEKVNSMTVSSEHVRDNHYLRSNFITEETLKILRRGLNIDIVESAFEKFMNKALKEALQTIPKDQFDRDNAVLSDFKSNFKVKSVDNEKWLIMPRKFTRSASRFTLPINTIKLNTLTPFEYLSQYVWISDHRKHLYRFVFNKYLSDPIELMDNDCNDVEVAERDTPSNDSNDKSSLSFYVFKECLMPFEKLYIAFVDVLGYCGPIEKCSEKITKIMELNKLNAIDHSLISFRSWCGLVAFAERYLNPLPFDVDPCDEVEIADFDTLERKFDCVTVSEPLKQILMTIKYYNRK